MAQFYEMPAISPTMEVGTLVEWQLAEGASFESGTVLAEIGTDKANMEAEIFDDGFLLKLLIEEGDEVPPGFPIAIWGEASDEGFDDLLVEFAERKAALHSGDSEAAEEEKSPTPEPVVAAPAPAPARPARAAAFDKERLQRTWMGKALSADFCEPPGDLGFGAHQERVAASPLARKIASERGIALHNLKGSGAGGRIVRADVEGAGRGGRSTMHAPRADEARKNSPMRKTIAKRLLASHQDIPTFFLTATFDMTACVSLRSMLKEQRPAAKFSYNDVVIKGVARALLEHPDVNASWGDDAITRHGRVDVGVAVAVEGGLITPVIRAAHTKSLSHISSEVRELAGRAKNQRLTPEEYTGGTFTISNLGMFGIDQFTAIINPPEAAILAVGRITEEPVVLDGELTVAHRMRVTMTCDHRVVDGAVGAAFLATLRTYLEHPTLLLVSDETL
jgi:pyruvate dehydrogenase E2 component (dihydrolipoamide acetyltransferase)